MPDTAARDIGVRIRAKREARRLTQGQLATYAGVKQTWLSNVETGEVAGPKPDLLLRVARELDTSIEYLLTGTEPSGLDPDAVALAREIARLPSAARGPIREFIHSMGLFISQTSDVRGEAGEQTGNEGQNRHHEQEQAI
jgi:transcriptional regulator with XRE-family HTH domain